MTSCLAWMQHVAMTVKMLHSGQLKSVPAVLVLRELRKDMAVREAPCACN